MMLQTVNRTDAEKIYGNFLNAAGATITTGYAVCFTTLVASADGNKAVLPAAGSNRTFAGICTSDVADNAVGRYQAYGYCASVFYFAEATSVSLTPGLTTLGPGVASSLGVGATGITYVLGPVVLFSSLGAIVRSAGGYVSGWVRAL